MAFQRHDKVLFSSPGFTHDLVIARKNNVKLAVENELGVNRNFECNKFFGASLNIKEGTNAVMGIVTLATGAATVSTTAVTGVSRIFLCSQLDGGIVGFQRVSARTAGTSFTITSSSAADTSTVAWIIVEPS